MQLMVYAQYGRAGIYMMQDYCRLLEVGATEEELRDLGAVIGALSADHPITGVARRAKDFRNPDALADALLHPQDRAYTVPQIYAWLERCGLSFCRWFEQAPYLPQCGAMVRMPHAARSRFAFTAIAARRGRVAARDHGQAQLHRLSQTIAAATASRSPSMLIRGGNTCLCVCRRPCAFGTGCLPAPLPS